MRLLSFVLTALLGASAVNAQIDVNAYIANELPIAKANLLANIGPSGSKSQGAKAGIVLASPSKTNPDYVYAWTRDSSLVYKALIDQYTKGIDASASLRASIDDFFASQKRLQQVPNGSGTAGDTGLGEPKFNIDESAFTGAWGRPQRDGPPLRAIALITYGNWLRAQGNTTYVTNTLWPVIKLDLDYTQKYWSQQGFDLWEEVNSNSFFTVAASHRALREGITFATAIGQTSVVAGYTTQAQNALCNLQTFWNSAGGYVTSNTGGGRSGKDANSVLTSIHSFDAEAGCDAATFQPCSDKALANLKVYVDSFRSIYAINSGIASNAAVATGRYSEDSYYGGNPWYLTTLAVAEQLYDALIVWNKQGSLEVTATSLSFFRTFSSSVAVGTYASTSSTFTTLTAAIKTYADGFVAVVAKYTPSNGGLSEQYTRATGAPTSATDLTWSYASAITTFQARSGFVPASWGAQGLQVPSTCGGGSQPGNQVAVTFNVQATTVIGENIYLTGSVQELQNWSPDTALILNADSYPIWKITVNLPASSSIEYKYIRKYNGATTWASGNNWVITTPASGTLTLNDVWR